MSKVIGSPTVTPINIKNLTADISKIQDLQRYYGDVSIVPSPAEWFNLNSGFLNYNPEGERLRGVVVVPYEYDGLLITGMESTSINGNGITRLILPGSLDYVGCLESANPQELVLCKGILEIEDAGLINCSALTKITIPKSINRIGEHAFFGCESLTDVYYEGSEKDWKKIEIADGNGSLLNANIHYQYAGETYSKEEVDDITGDIETALDSIIAIQNELIGGGTV